MYILTNYYGYFQISKYTKVQKIVTNPNIPITQLQKLSEICLYYFIYFAFVCVYA